PNKRELDTNEKATTFSRNFRITVDGALPLPVIMTAFQFFAMNQSNFTLAAIAACAAFVFSPQPARGAFSLDDDGSRVTVTEDGQPVFTYQYGRVNPPKGTAPHYWRSNYIHPLYGLDGEVLTQDFPEDHPHHRGVFWTWPVVAVDGRSTSPWELNTSRQLFIEWIDKEATGD